MSVIFTLIKAAPRRLRHLVQSGFDESQFKDGVGIMRHGEVTCVRGGRTFRGHFETVGHDDVTAVSLRFGNRSISAALGHDDPERVALRLLGKAAAGLPEVLNGERQASH